MLPVILDAINFAAHAHRKGRRKDGKEDKDRSAYINHPLRVAQLVQQHCRHYDYNKRDTTDVIIAAVLHDTVEDTDVTLDQIKEKYGVKVADLVDEVTEWRQIGHSSEIRKIIQIQGINKISDFAKVIRLADKISNVEDTLKCPYGWTPKRMQTYFAFCYYIGLECKGVSKDCLEPILAKLLDSNQGKFVVEGKEYETMELVDNEFLSYEYSFESTNTPSMIKVTGTYLGVDVSGTYKLVKEE